MIDKHSRFRWVRPTASYLRSSVRVWQPMLHVPEGVNMFNDTIREHYQSHNDVSHYPDECELGPWVACWCEGHSGETECPHAEGVETDGRSDAQP